MCAATSNWNKPLDCTKKFASLVRTGDYDPSKAHSMTTAVSRHPFSSKFLKGMDSNIC